MNQFYKCFLSFKTTFEHMALESFFQNELCTHLKNIKSQFIVSFGIGTYSDINQEFDNLWLKKIGSQITNQTIFKIFYLIDPLYTNSFNEQYIKNIENQLSKYASFNNELNPINLQLIKNLYSKIDTYVDNNHSIIIHKIPFKLISDYDASCLYYKILSGNKINVTYSSKPKQAIWYHLYTYFHNIMNNNPLTNSKMPIYDSSNKNPKYKNCNIGKYLEYISELGFIIKHLFDISDTWNHNINKRMFFKRFYGSGNKEIIPFENLGSFNKQKIIWNPNIDMVTV